MRMSRIYAENITGAANSLVTCYLHLKFIILNSSVKLVMKSFFVPIQVSRHLEIQNS